MKPEDIADAFGTRDPDRRIDLAARNRLRALESREFKLASIVSGLYGYTAFTVFVASASLAFANGRAQAYALFLFCLGALFALSIWRLWRRTAVDPWLLAAPALLTLGLAIVLGTWLTVGFALNLAACGAIYALTRVWRERAAATRIAAAEPASPP